MLLAKNEPPTFAAVLVVVPAAPEGAEALASTLSMAPLVAFAAVLLLVAEPLDPMTVARAVPVMAPMEELFAVAVAVPSVVRQQQLAAPAAGFGLVEQVERVRHTPILDAGPAGLILMEERWS